MGTDTITAARALADTLAKPGSPDLLRGAGPTPSRFFAIGDPQGPADALFGVLDRYALLGDDGRLRPDVGLMSMGDHFDYHAKNIADAGGEGLKILAWLAGHPPNQVPILIGNHDISRVSELVGLSDVAYAQAAKDARAIDKAAPEKRADLTRRFHEEYAGVPTPSITVRDYSSYSEAQRRLVASLILRGRLRLGCAAELLSGEPVLATHAGVTVRELELLDAAPTPASVAARLTELLDRAVDGVRASWEADNWTPIDLGPAHVCGVPRSEGGGLLYHRPADPRPETRKDADLEWEFAPERARRFDPRRLPLGLVQLCGHTKHEKTRKELAAWMDETPGWEGRPRTLSSDGHDVRYVTAQIAPIAGEACLYMIDGDLAGNAASVELFELAGWSA